MTDHHEDSWGDRPNEEGFAPTEGLPTLSGDDGALRHSPDLGENREPGGADTRLGDLGGQGYGTDGAVSVPMTESLTGSSDLDEVEREAPRLRPEDEVGPGGPREPDELGRLDPASGAMSHDNR